LKGRILVLFFLLIVISTQVFAFGRKEADAPKTQNDEWILCITSFDISSLPPEKATIAPVILREIVERLKTISYRTRISPEYTFYEELAWAREQSTAAKAIATKMDERSAELYRGNPGWRYRQNITKIDNDLIKLRANLEKIENNAPVVNKEPVFNLTRENLQLTFPAAPAKGAESRFATTQRADGFITGSIRDFHGRYILSVKLYTVYTRSFVWEDSIIFSQEDITSAIDEFTQKLIIILGGNEPAVVAIKAEPDDTLVLINRSFAGKGSTDLMELPPATIIVTASAPHHESITFETVLSAEELTSININLNPIRYTDINIFGNEGRVYHGALYIGKAPLTLRLPVSHPEYIELDTGNSRKGTIVFQTPELTNISTSYNVKTKQVLPAGRVKKHREIFYWSWGCTWLAYLTFKIADASYEEAGKVLDTVYSNNPGFLNDYYMMKNIRDGAMVVSIAAVSYSAYRFLRYLYTANRGSTPVVKPGRK